MSQFTLSSNSLFFWPHPGCAWAPRVFQTNFMNFMTSPILRDQTTLAWCYCGRKYTALHYNEWMCRTLFIFDFVSTSTLTALRLDTSFNSACLARLRMVGKFAWFDGVFRIWRHLLRNDVSLRLGFRDRVWIDQCMVPRYEIQFVCNNISSFFTEPSSGNELMKPFITSLNGKRYRGFCLSVMGVPKYLGDIKFSWGRDLMDHVFVTVRNVNKKKTEQHLRN